MPIHTVIFDLGGVYFTNGARGFVRKMKELYGVPQEKMLEIIGGELGTQYRTGDITPDVFWKKAKEIWNVSAETDELSKLWLDDYKPIPGTSVLIEKLSKAGYEILFLSDNAPDRVDYLESQYHFLKKFKDGVFSHLERTRKPNEKMYTAALAIASNPASECVYIDDKPHLLEPAKSLGMSVIAFVSPEQVENDLWALGLTF